MTDHYVTVDEVKAFLGAHPDVRWIDLFTHDLNGIARGKRLRRDDLVSAAEGGILIPGSVFIMDPRGNCIEETGRLWEGGDPDLPCRMIAGTLKHVPVNGGTHAQAVIDVKGNNDIDPRSVLTEQAARFQKTGLTPVVAVELEFYVMAPRTNGVFQLNTPPGLSADPDWPMTFSFEDMDILKRLIDDIYTIGEAQGLPVEAVMQESGPGQFEINLKHRADPVAAALDGLLLKRAVKAAALANNVEATFMAKPHHEWAGSGLHVHVSVLDSKGNNIFIGDPNAREPAEPLVPAFKHAIGGLLKTMPDFMAIWAQSANSYRRYVPKSYVSMAPHWGFNNRTVALRIPGGNVKATRVEHRVSGADANPYLVVAAILAGIQHGINNKIDCGPCVKGNSEELNVPPLPTSWVNALDVFSKSPVVAEAFGTSFQHVYTQLKQTERANFERIVTPLDHLWYSQVA
jgi:glutamine synthetase